MDFVPSERSRILRERVDAFMHRHVLPSETTHYREARESDNPYAQTPTMGALKEKARADGLWNLFLKDERWGPGLSNVEYAPLAESMGQSLIGPEVFNCDAPDTGNMEVFARFGTPEQQEQWLPDLLEGRTRSSFIMTEPKVSSSDATNIESTIRREGEEYVIDGHKWWITNGPRPNTSIGMFLGVTDRDADRHAQHSLVLVPFDTPGVTVKRSLSVLGYEVGAGHADMVFENVRVPVTNLVGEEGAGFKIAQARLGPGRIHHCMRAIGQAERALHVMCERASTRTAFGERLIDRETIRTWIASSRMEIEQARLLTLHAAWLMDTIGPAESRAAISAIKVVAPKVALTVIDRAMQVCGAQGLSQDTPLAHHLAHARTLRYVDGPDEVHVMTVAKEELRSRNLLPSR